MSNAANQSRIVLGTTCMEITREPVANNSTELIQKIQIVGVYPITIQSKPSGADASQWTYRFDKMVLVDVRLSDGSNFSFETQEITNQATWNLGTLAAQQACITDINAWL